MINCIAMRSSVFKISSVNVETTTTYTVKCGNRPSTYGFLPLGGHKILRVRGGHVIPECSVVTHRVLRNFMA